MWRALRGLRWLELASWALGGLAWGQAAVPEDKGLSRQILPVALAPAGKLVAAGLAEQILEVLAAARRWCGAADRDNGGALQSHREGRRSRRSSPGPGLRDGGQSRTDGWEGAQ